MIHCRVMPISQRVVLLSFSIISVEASNIWHISIDESPAPAPEAGPPFSAHASRDRTLLPAQICGIIGAYLGVVFILGFFLLTLGRRQRTTAMSSQQTLGMELVKPANRVFESSPISPDSASQRWYSPKKARNRIRSNSVRSGITPVSPPSESIASFDAKVIQADKLARQDEMERLYAAVMIQNEDENNENPHVASHVEPPRMERTEPPARRVPPRLITSAPALQHLRNIQSQKYPTSPSSTRSPIRAIYPPDSPIPLGPRSPTSPIRAEYGVMPVSPHYVPQYPPNLHGRAGQITIRTPASPASYAPSARSEFSSQGKPSKLRRSLQKIRITPPTTRYPGEEDSDSGRTPLSPRWNDEPGDLGSPVAKSEAPSTPATYRSRQFDLDSNDEFDEYQRFSCSASHRMPNNTHEVPPYVLNRPRTASLSLPSSPKAFKLNANAGTDLPGSPRLTYQSPQSNMSNGTVGSLPFRKQHPLAPMRSPELRTTYLERGRDMMGAPRTGMATPYSPYMPFTPLTPVTPHLTSRAERRQREREESRRVLGQEDAVIDENEMWGSAY